MYTRDIPLWAQAYHLFQNSTHGKYRYVPVKFIEPNDDHDISRILRKFQSEEADSEFKDFDTWLKSFIGKDPEANEDTVLRKIDEIYNFIMTLDEPEEYDIVYRRNKKRDHKKSLNQIVSHAKALLTKAVVTQRKKRIEKERKIKTFKNNILRTLTALVAIDEGSVFDYSYKNDKDLRRKIKQEDDNFIITKDLSLPVLKNLYEKLEKLYRTVDDIREEMAQDEEQKRLEAKRKKEKLEKDKQELIDKIYVIFDQIPDKLIQSKTLKITVSDLGKLGKKALENRLEKYINYVRQKEMFCKEEDERIKEIKRLEVMKANEEALKEAEEVLARQKEQERIEQEKIGLIRKIKFYYAEIESFDKRILSNKKATIRNLEAVDKWGFNKLKSKCEKLQQIWAFKETAQEDVEKALKDKEIAAKRKKDAKNAAILNRKQQEKKQELTNFRQAAKEEFEKQSLPICTRIFDNNEGGYKLYSTGDDPGNQYYVSQNNGATELLSIQYKEPPNELNSYVIYKTKGVVQLAGTYYDNIKKWKKLNGKFLMTEANRFEGAKCDNVEVYHDVDIPVKNLDGILLQREQMSDPETIRLDFEAYTKTVWREHTNKKGENEELKPDTIQLKVLVSNPSDVLIAHKPGEGKTSNAIILAEMKRNIILKKDRAVGDMTKILVIAPNASILYQWQKEVVNWGFDPRHWIFQTVSHFVNSKRTNKYPEWKDLSDDNKMMYDEIWKHPKYAAIIQDDDYNSTTVDNSSSAFDPPLEKDQKRLQIRKLIKTCLFDTLNNKWIRNLRALNFVWNGYDAESEYFPLIAKFFLCEKRKISACHYEIVPNNRSIDFNFFHEYRADIIIYKQGNELHILSDLDVEHNPDNENETGCPFVNHDSDFDDIILDTMVSEKHAALLKKVKSIFEAKKLIEQVNEGTYPNINSVDKFINPAHGKNLVQHRYGAPEGTIFIIDECHKVLSGDANEEDKVQTEAIFEYARTTISNILVSATPWLSRNYMNSMRITAQFLARDWKREIGEIERVKDNNGNYLPITKEQKEESVKSIYKALYGKITRAIYNDEIIALNERIKDTKFLEDEKGLDFLYKVMYQNEINWDYYRNVETRGLKVDTKKDIIKSTFLSFGVEKESTRENPFPAKVRIGNGFKEVECDTLRKEIMMNDPIDLINPDLAYYDMDGTDGDVNELIIFHKEASEDLRDKYPDHPFIPLVVSVKYDSEDKMRTLRKLQKYAYSHTKAWIVVLHVTDTDPESIEIALRKINVKKYNETLMMDPVFHPERERTRRATNFGHDEIDEFIIANLPLQCNIKWLQVRSGDTYNSIPGLLSSKIEQIVLMIEDAVKQSKNVLVYHDKVEILLAIQQGLEARRNTRVDLSNGWSDRKAELMDRMMQNKLRKWRRWDMNDRINDIKACQELCQGDVNDDNRMLARLKGDFHKCFDDFNMSNRGDKYGNVEMLEKYSYLKKLSEQKRPLYMKRLKESSFTANDNGMWELKDGRLITCSDEKKGWLPATETEYDIFQLKNWRNLYDLEKYFKQTITEVRALFAKRDKDGKIKTIMEAYELFFESLVDLYGEDATDLARIANIMQTRLNLKNIKTNKDDFVNKIKIMNQRLSEFSFRLKGENSLEPIGEEFLTLALSYLKMQLDEIGITKVQETPYWTEILRKDVITILYPTTTKYYGDDTYDHGVIFPQEMDDDNGTNRRRKMDKGDLPEYASNLMSKRDGYFQRLKRPSQVSNKLKNKLVSIARKYDETCVSHIRKIEKYGGKYYHEKDKKKNKNLQSWGSCKFIEYANYLYEIITEKRKEEILYMFGEKFDQPDRHLHLAPHEKLYIHQNIMRAIKDETTKYEGKIFELEQEINGQRTQIELWEKWLDEKKTNLDRDSKEYKQISHFMNDEKPVDAFGCTHIVQASTLKKLNKELKEEFKTLWNDKHGLLYNELPETLQKALFNATHNIKKIKYHKKMIREKEKEIKGLKKNDSKILNGENVPTRLFPKRPNDPAIRKLFERHMTEQENDDLYQIIQTKYTEFDKRKKATEFDMTDMSYQEVYDLWDEFETLNVDYNTNIKINNWDYINNTTMLNEWEYAKEDDGTGTYIGEGSGVMRDTPDSKDYQRPYPIDTIDKQHHDFKNQYPADANGNGIGYSTDFSYLRYTNKNKTIKQMKKRIKSMIPDKVAFSILSGVHSDAQARLAYKLAFECGLIDCILMSSAVREGIDYLSLSESLCICVEPQKIPDVENQFVGRLVRKHSHDAIPKPFRRVEYVSFQNVIGDKVMEVQRYKMKHTQQDIDHAADVLTEDETSWSGLTHMWDDNPEESSGRSVRSQNNKNLIKRIIDYRKTLDEKFWLNEKQAKQVIKEVLKHERTKQLSPDEIFNRVVNIRSTIISEQEDYRGADIDQDDETAIDETIEYMEKLANRSVTHIDTYINVSTVITYNNHVFYRPYDVLKSNFEYEYGARSFSEDDDAKNTVSFGWVCPLCNFESNNKDICVNCKAPINNYYKMEPYYLDDDIVFDYDYITRDTYKKETYEKIYKALDLVTANLLPISVEHVAKCKKDMVMKLSTKSNNDDIVFHQRIVNPSDKLPSAYHNASTRFQLVHADFDEVQLEDEEVVVESKDDSEDEEVLETKESSSEEDEEEIPSPKKKRKLNNKAAFPMSDSDDESSDEDIQSEYSDDEF